jgi:hypothetical protein
MPAPKGQIRKLFDAIESAPMLKKYPGGVRVLLGARHRAYEGAPPRIVVYPKSGKITSPGNKQTAIRDVDRSIIVQLWGEDFDQVEDLQKKLFQATAYQAAGGYAYQSNLAAGEFWQAFDEEWDDDDEDSDKQGEVVYLRFVVRHSIDKPPITTGGVESTLLQRSTVLLTAPIGAADDVAPVSSTEGFAPSGVLTIDSEQTQYTGKTATSFTGLVRGVNFTVAASHLVGATVNVS